MCAIFGFNSRDEMLAHSAGISISARQIVKHLSSGFEDEEITR